MSTLNVWRRRWVVAVIVSGLAVLGGQVPVGASVPDGTGDGDGVATSPEPTELIPIIVVTEPETTGPTESSTPDTTGPDTPESAPVEIVESVGSETTETTETTEEASVESSEVTTPDVAETVTSEPQSDDGAAVGDESVPAMMLMAEPSMAILAELEVAAVEKVLILGSTVSGGATSLEAQAAEALGFTVEVVDDAGWGAHTTEEFAAYRALVLGDATCGGSATAAAANNTVWGPAVDGNIVLNGTDPVYHQTQGGQALVDAGIAFATAAAGTTGMYISLSCYFHAAAPDTPVPLLDPFGSFTVTGVGCFNDAHIVATHPALSGLIDAELSNWSCSVHEAFDEWPTAGPDGFTVLAIAEGAGAIYTAPDGSVGIPYILARGAGLAAGDISLNPPTDTAPADGSTELCMTALVASGGAPQAAQTVRFAVTSGPNAGLVLADGVTSADGTVTRCYASSVAGVDAVRASFLDPRGVTQVSNSVERVWTGSGATTTAPSTSPPTTAPSTSPPTTAPATSPPTTASSTGTPTTPTVAPQSPTPAGALPATGASSPLPLLAIGAMSLLVGLAAVAMTRSRPR